MWPNLWSGPWRWSLLAESGVPVSIGKQSNDRQTDDLALLLGDTSADVLRLHIAVIDREDRLESGTGEWRTTFTEDDLARDDASREAILRALRTAFDPVNFSILRSLSEHVGTPIEQLAEEVGLGRLPLAERIGDLVSAGLVTKIPEANQVAGSELAAALVDLVVRGAEAGGRRLGQVPG